MYTYGKDEVLESERGKKRILLVEDDLETLRMIRWRLESRSFEIVTAADENEFWKSASDPGISLIILDICLRNHLGTDVYRKLLEPESGRHIPVIFTTGGAVAGGSPENKRVLREDTYSFMEKPIEFGKLSEEINRLLKTEK